MGGEEEVVGHWGEELGIGAEGRRVLEEDGEKGLGSGGWRKRRGGILGGKRGRKRREEERSLGDTREFLKGEGGLGGSGERG